METRMLPSVMILALVVVAGLARPIAARGDTVAVGFAGPPARYQSRDHDAGGQVPYRLLPHELDLDPLRVAELGNRLKGLDRVLVIAGRETLLAERPRVTSASLRLESVVIHEGHSYRTLPEPREIPWVEIESIRARGRGARRGALFGALIGGAVGIAVGAHQPCEEGSDLAGTSGNCAERRAVPILLGTVGGAAIGAWIGHHSERWQPVYP